MNSKTKQKPRPFDWPGYKPVQPRRPKKPRRKQGRLTALACKPHNGPTTTLNGNAAPRKLCGFFAPAIRLNGPLTHAARFGECRFSRIGKSRFTSRTKGVVRHAANKGGRFRAVVAAEACRPVSGRVGFGFVSYDFGVTTMTANTHTPGIVCPNPTQRTDHTHGGDSASMGGTVETRPNPRASLPDIISGIDDFDLALSKFESVLGLLLQNSQQGELSGDLDGVLSALEFLAENANAEYLKLCGAIPQIEAEQPAAHLKRAGAVIEECRAVLWILVDYCGSNRDSRCPHKTHSALSAAGSLSKLAGLEIGQFWALLRETLVLEICAGNGKEDKTHAAG